MEVILAGFAGGHIYPKERCYACFSMLLLFTATSEVYSAFVSELRRGDSYLDAFLSDHAVPFSCKFQSALGFNGLQVLIDVHSSIYTSMACKFQSAFTARSYDSRMLILQMLGNLEGEV